MYAFLIVVFVLWIWAILRLRSYNKKIHRYKQTISDQGKTMQQYVCQIQLQADLIETQNNIIETCERQIEVLKEYKKTLKFPITLNLN